MLNTETRNESNGAILSFKCYFILLSHELVRLSEILASLTKEFFIEQVLLLESDFSKGFPIILAEVIVNMLR